MTIPIQQHGLVGDGRTAALVAADGSIDWLCLPRFDAAPVFGSLLDPARGGSWRLGPSAPVFGHQHYLEDGGILVTGWNRRQGSLELADALLLPPDNQAPDRPVMIRRLRCLRGASDAGTGLWPQRDFDRPPSIQQVAGGLALAFPDLELGCWTSRPLELLSAGAAGRWQLEEGDEVWAVLGVDLDPAAWDVDRAQRALDETRRSWSAMLGARGEASPVARRFACLVRMLTYAPSGAPVAAPTTSLPERPEGERNWDYRYCWLRDSSIALAALCRLGETTGARRFFGWLAGLGSRTEAPWQPVYRVDGALDLPVSERCDLAGYLDARPVMFGNRAARQRQPGSLGFLGECIWQYHLAGGIQDDGHWRLVQRLADHVARSWRAPDSGIWELPREAAYLDSRVMSWVALDRALKLAVAWNCEAPASWRTARDSIFAEVMQEGYSAERRSFRQVLGQGHARDGLDASALLIPLMGMLSPGDPRVVSTVDCIQRTLMEDGFVYRFDPRQTPGLPACVPQDFEGAFLPCCCWLAEVLAAQGRNGEALALLERLEALAGEVGLFAEEADRGARRFLGNYPLLFTQASYVTASLATGKSLRSVRTLVPSGSTR